MINNEDGLAEPRFDLFIPAGHTRVTETWQKHGATIDSGDLRSTRLAIMATQLFVLNTCRTHFSS